MRELYDPIRQKWILATPEEIVRQKLIAYLVKEKGFPHEIITLEKELRQLPFLKEEKNKIPERRLDILCFGPKLAYPLLLVECKAVSLHENMLGQLCGYNAFVKAPFIALVNESEYMVRWEREGGTLYFESIPKYEELIAVYQNAKYV